MGERVCVLSGCVTTFYNYHDERDAHTRTSLPTPHQTGEAHAGQRASVHCLVPGVVWGGGA